MGDTASPTTGLSASLRSAGFALGRLKTGTPARLLKSSINFANLEEQLGDTTPHPFSFLHSSVPNASNQVSCYKTYTSALTRQIVLDNLHRSIHIRETVKGPRYCPSLEAKILRFGDREAHVVWLEPEGYDSELIYPNGISCSMPEEVQVDLVRSIPGLEKAEIVRPAYGVEYDHVDARELRGAFFPFPFSIFHFTFPVLRLLSVPVPPSHRTTSHHTASHCSALQFLRDPRFLIFRSEGPALTWCATGTRFSDARDEADRRAVSRRADQWNDRIRRGGCTGCARRDQCRSQGVSTTAFDCHARRRVYWCYDR